MKLSLKAKSILFSHLSCNFTIALPTHICKFGCLLSTYLQPTNNSHLCSKHLHASSYPTTDIFSFLHIITRQVLTKVKPNVNSVGIHPQLSHKRLPMDDGSLTLWSILRLMLTNWTNSSFPVSTFYQLLALQSQCTNHPFLWGGKGGGGGNQSDLKVKDTFVLCRLAFI
jgi:hypothetical protein